MKDIHLKLILDLIAEVEISVREWAKKVDDLLKDVVYGCIIKYFQLSNDYYFIETISNLT